jgi:hypothetical protein
MDAREKEENLLVKCMQVGLLQPTKVDEIDANIFLVASKLIINSFPVESARLKDVGINYLSGTGTVPMKCEELIRSRFITSLPRFKQMLEDKFRKNHYVV